MPLVPEVEVARRLVEQEHARLLGERPGQERPLALPAGERVDRVVGEVEDCRPAPSPRGAREVLRPLEEPARPAREASHQHQLLDADRERERLLLRDHRDLAREGQAPHGAERLRPGTGSRRASARGPSRAGGGASSCRSCWGRPPRGSRPRPTSNEVRASGGTRPRSRTPRRPRRSTGGRSRTGSRRRAARAGCAGGRRRTARRRTP